MNFKNLILSIPIIFFIISSQINSQDGLYLIATLTGESHLESVNSAIGVGDINGDGYDDILVGIPLGNYIKLYYGGNILDTVNYITITGGNEVVGFGNSLTSIGDVNKDGFKDFLVKGNLKGFPKGKIFLYLGGNVLDTIADFEFQEPWIQDQLGLSSSGLGDVNGDGYDDFIVGSPYNWTDFKGRAYLFLGRDTLHNQPDITFTGIQGGWFGENVSGLGDINNDGFNDYSIAEPEGETDSNYTMNIYFGSDILDSNPSFKIISNDSLKASDISYAGDVDNDGFSDFFLKEPLRLLLGEKDSVGSISIYFTSNDPHGAFGTSISLAGDINSDGFDDFLIGAPNFKNKDSIRTGRVYVYLGKNETDAETDFFIDGETKGSRFGFYISSAGDINNDGYDEIIICAPSYPNSENYLGKVYLYSFKNITGIDDLIKRIPINFKLFQNYPNPFNPSTTITWQIASTSKVKIILYDIVGEEIAILINEEQPAGKHNKELNAEKYKLSSGIYLVKLEINNQQLSQSAYKTKKIILLK